MHSRLACYCKTGNSQGRLTNVPHAEVCHNELLPEPFVTVCCAALQDAWTPLKVASAVAIINLAGDYYLIIQRGLGVIGAGITCPVAQYFGAIVFIIYLQRMGRRDKGIPLSWQVLHHSCSRQLGDPCIGCTVYMFELEPFVQEFQNSDCETPEPTSMLGPIWQSACIQLSYMHPPADRWLPHAGCTCNHSCSPLCSAGLLR